MSDDSPERVEIAFEHRDGWETGQVGLPTGLRHKADIDEDGEFRVEFPTTESLVSNPTFQGLIEAGHTPIDSTVPEDDAEAVQQRLATDTGDDPATDADGGTAADDGASGDDGGEPDDGLGEMERSELYERAHNDDAVPDDEIPDWNESDAEGLRELIREYTE